MTNSERLRIGSRKEEVNFAGLIDDVRFYGRALSAEDARLLAFQGMMPIIAKWRGKRSEEERDDLRRFYKENYAVDYLRSEAALTRARKAKDDLIAAIPTSMIMEEMDPPRETFQLIRGDFRNKGEKVAANTPAFLPAIRKAIVENKGGRLQLAARELDPTDGVVTDRSSERAADVTAAAGPSPLSTSENTKGANTTSSAKALAAQAPDTSAPLNRLDL